MKVKSEREVAQSCPTLHDPMDCSLPGSFAQGFSRQEYWSRVPLPSPTYKAYSPVIDLYQMKFSKQILQRVGKLKLCQDRIRNLLGGKGKW